MRIKDKIKSNIVSIVIASLFVLMFIFRGYADAFYNSQRIDNAFANSLKYVVFAISSLIMFIYLVIKIRNKEADLIFKKQYFTIVVMLSILFVISIIRSLMVWNFSMMTIKGLLYIFMPATYGFLIINTLNTDMLYKSLIGILFVSIFFYLIQVTIANIDELTQGIENISFINESEYFCGTACALAIYFALVNRSKTMIGISQIFNIMTFKRPLIVIALVVLIITRIPWFKKKPDKKFLYAAWGFFVVVSVGYLLLLALSYPNELLTKFTTGRNKFLNDLLTKDYVSYGYYSSVDFYRNIEMDFVRILLETGIIGLAVFIYAYLNLSKDNFYSFIIMILLMFVMLFTDTINNNFVWIIYYIVLSHSAKKEIETRGEVYEEFSLYNSTNL